MPVDHSFVWCMCRPVDSRLQGLSKLCMHRSRHASQSREVARCPARGPLSSPAQIPTWLLAGPADEAKKLAIQQQDPGRRVADPSGPPWWPDIPLRGRLAEEGDSGALLAASQRMQALPPAPRASRVCRGSAGRTLTQPGASWMKSLKNCLMRLCQTEGSASSTHSRPRPGGHS